MVINCSSHLHWLVIIPLHIRQHFLYPWIISALNHHRRILVNRHRPHYLLLRSISHIKGLPSRCISPRIRWLALHSSSPLCLIILLCMQWLYCAWIQYPITHLHYLFKWVLVVVCHAVTHLCLTRRLCALSVDLLHLLEVLLSCKTASLY
jgi:hypothetical protein